MRYDDYLSSLSSRVDQLSDRAQSAFYWICGEGLLEGLEASEEWWSWIRDVSHQGFLYATTGLKSSETWLLLRSQCLDHSESEEMDERLQSVAVCFFESINDEPGTESRKYAEIVFWPLMFSESMRLFDEVDWDELDTVYNQPRFQKAVAFIDAVVDNLTETPEPTSQCVLDLKQGSIVLSPL